MTPFDEREKAFESKFKRELELEFQIKAHWNKLLGLWAGDVMGYDTEGASLAWQ